MTKGKISGKIKEKAEDFIVKEIAIDGKTVDENYRPSFLKGGDHLVFILKKVMWTTDMAIREIAKRLHISPKRFAYAGMKDKKAITYQLCSGYKVEPTLLKEISVKDINVIPLGFHNDRIALGVLEGNYFNIFIRNMKGEPTKIERQLSGKFPNYYGLQRFGNSNISLRVGLLLLKLEFEKAVWEFLTGERNENEEAKEARKLLAETADFKYALQIFPKFLKHERLVLSHLTKHPRDFVNALRRLPKGIRTMFVHAVQAYIFNEELSMRIRDNYFKPLPEDIMVGKDFYGFPTKEKGKDFLAVHLVGYETIPNVYQEQILDKLGISPNHFKIKNMPEASSKGDVRVLLAPYKNFKITNNWLSFSLPKGSYATSFLREFLKKDIA